MALIGRPIVIIGAGRSGTSLLDAMLDAHPEIAMYGEFGGTVDQLWRLFWQVSAAETHRSRRIDAIRHAAPEPAGTSDAEIFTHVRDLERLERARVAGIVRTALDQLYNVAESSGRYWGFKEIWAGDAALPDWQACDTVFPEATYLHIVRHPFEFARSSADWQRLPFTRSQLQADLTAWLRYLRMNAGRAETGRYFRLTYEALLADPAAALDGLFEHLGLRWDDRCAAASSRRFVPSGAPSPYPPGLAAIRDAVPGLAKAMAEFGYALPEESGETIAPEPGTANAIDAQTWLLNPPFQAETGAAWTARLHMAPGLACLEAQADNLEHPYRSPVMLYEDGVALGPAHSLHALIRAEGHGRFSHWGPQHVLLFATSDNSDPNRNGRRYTISA
ncbi:MAG: sulfotransferase [Aliidongia sp.]